MSLYLKQKAKYYNTIYSLPKHKKVAFCVVIDFVNFFIFKSRFFFKTYITSYIMFCNEIVQI